MTSTANGGASGRRFVTKWISFELPDELHDCTDYVFEAEEPFERLTVNISSPDEEGESPDARIARLREDMEGFCEGRAVVEEQGSLIVDGERGAMVRARLAMEDEPWSMRAVVLPLGEDLLGMVYLAASGTNGPDRFDQIIDSVRLPPSKPENHPPEDFTHFPILGVSLDVPSRLSPPTSYLLSDASGDLELALAIYPVTGQERPPELEDEVRRDTQYGDELTDRFDEERSVDTTACHIARYLLSEKNLMDPDAEPDSRAVCRALVTLAGKMTLSLVGEAEPPQRDRLHAAIDQLVDAVLDRERDR